MMLSVRETARDTHASAVLVLSDGTVFKGLGFGAETTNVGELCFNTSITGYQEILTDPSYAGQLITFTFPHIGNVGTNTQDIETTTPSALGLIVRADITEPANFRSDQPLPEWLVARGLPGIAGIDTRALTRRIRAHGAPNAVLCHRPDGRFDIPALIQQAKEWPGLLGMDLAKDVTTRQRHDWQESRWRLGQGYQTQQDGQKHVVAIDYGIKRNILRELTAAGCRVTVVPASTSAEDILALSPDGLFLSNGPGDPAATGVYAVPTIKKLLASDLPLFGICLGHQMLGLALGAKTIKMKQGHRGANHPIKDFETGKVEITSQNHGFVVDDQSLPDQVIVTHRSLFDGTLAGLRLKDRPVFSVQYHPEASPGPQDSHYLFQRFVESMN